uniref:WAP domain-containing protein n=1 Tax=Cyanoderma ruficeps TaxID=181631 RepID=A0A8C3QS32_9PASS
APGTRALPSPSLHPHRGLSKPGFCPWKRVQRRAAACPNRCTDDRDCPGEHKCCFSSCGLACTPPDTERVFLHHSSYQLASHMEL